MTENKMHKYVDAGMGPQDGAWRAQYLLCPYCHEILEKNSKTKECTCGNISIDGSMLRIFVLVDEKEIPTFDLAPEGAQSYLTIDQIRANNYKTILTPIETKIRKIFIRNTSELIVLEDYYTFSKESNLYLVNLKHPKKVHFLELQSSKDYYVSANYFGQTYVEATSFDCVKCTIDLKSRKIIDSVFVK